MILLPYKYGTINHYYALNFISMTSFLGMFNWVNTTYIYSDTCHIRHAMCTLNKFYDGLDRVSNYIILRNGRENRE